MLFQSRAAATGNTVLLMVACCLHRTVSDDDEAEPVSVCTGFLRKTFFESD